MGGAQGQGKQGRVLVQVYPEALDKGAPVAEAVRALAAARAGREGPAAEAQRGREEVQATPVRRAPGEARRGAPGPQAEVVRVA